MSNFWQTLQTPTFALAPMEDVTDTVFRELVMTLSDPTKLNLYFTEFTSIDGLCHPVGFDKVSHRLFVNPSEKDKLKAINGKLIAQIWGNDPEKFIKAVKIIQDMGHFDGIDINMGCPDKSVVKHGSGSALIENPSQVTDIIHAVREHCTLPLSIKTRIGVKQVITETWLSHLLSLPIDALTVHGRTQKQMSDGLADWDEIGKAVTIRNQLNKTIPIFGNGDVLSVSDGIDKCNKYNLSGIMVGRGIFHDPWMFGKTKESVTLSERLNVLLQHTNNYHHIFENRKNFAQLKRFFKIYINSFDGASQLRDALMHTNSHTEVNSIVESFIKSNAH